jgi:amphi-Trp domain-containing protein
MGSKNSFEYSQRTGREDVALYLENLAGHIRSGSISLSAGTKAIQLDVGPSVRFELEAKARPEKGKNSLQFEMEWSDGI